MKVISVLILAACTYSVKLPSSFKKCNRKDLDADKCYLEAAQNGISQLTKAFPEIHLANFSPLEITELKIGASGNSVVNVEQNFKNCKIYGIDQIKLDAFRINFAEKNSYVSGVIPEVKKICDYEINGKILLLPVIGKGQSTVILKNVNITIHFDFEDVKRKGKTYHLHTKQKLTLDPEFVSFDFENLFNGDKLLHDNINKVMNDNWRQVFEDVKGGYEEAIGLILLEVVRNVFEKVSVEEAFD